MSMKDLAPGHYGLIFAGVFFVFGLLVNPWLSVPLAIAGFIVGVVVGFAQDKAEHKQKIERSIEAGQERKAERAATLVRFGEYLANLPVEGNDVVGRIKKTWEERNEVYNRHGNRPDDDTYFDIIEGNKAHIQEKLESEIRMYHTKQFDRECGGWAAFLGMLRRKENSCDFRWGVNRKGLEFHRASPDHYVVARKTTDSYYK